MLSALIADIHDRDFLSPRNMSRRLRLSLADLAKLAGVHRNTLAQRPESPSVQKGLGLVAKILAIAEQFTGNADQAIIWFRYQPIAALGCRTALELVAAGHPNAVLAHLEDLRDGTHA